MLNRNTVVRTEQLEAGFGDRLLFRDLNLAIHEGDFAFIRGENGSGKTTLVKIILGLIPPRAGRVFVMDREVGTREWRRHRAQVAYMTQHEVKSDFPIAALEVALIGTAGLRAGRHDKTALARQAMALTNCLHLERTPYAVLSGGEKRRVSLARCLAQQARLLILDEPASHLDRPARAELSAILARLNRDRGITVLLVSHEHHDSFPASPHARLISFENGEVSMKRSAPGAQNHGKDD